MILSPPRVPRSCQRGSYPPDFFDCIVVDECHRGGAHDESTWRGILEYFEPAVQLGLTATPKRRDNVDTYAYFGEPVYVYSLRQGIKDGFLTPFKVRQVCCRRSRARSGRVARGRGSARCSRASSRSSSRSCSRTT